MQQTVDIYEVQDCFDKTKHTLYLFPITTLHAVNQNIVSI